MVDHVGPQGNYLTGSKNLYDEILYFGHYANLHHAHLVLAVQSNRSYLSRKTKNGGQPRTNYSNKNCIRVL